MLRQRRPKSPTRTSHHNTARAPPTASPDSIAMQSISGEASERKALLGSGKETSDAALSGQHVSSLPPPHRSVSPSSKREDEEGAEMDRRSMSRKSQWVMLAFASGGCAAFNGVFAKLTTTELTTSFATGIANLIGLSSVEGGVEIVVRAIFFALNLVFNGIMWALFTRALALGTSTTQVSILNTSSNFMITAVLGFLIFSESLPPLWFLGAALLVAGNVIIGRRDEGDEKLGDYDALEQDRAETGTGRYTEDARETLAGGSMELDENMELERKRKEEEDDILNLGSENEEEISPPAERLV